VDPRSGLNAVETRVPCPCQESYRKFDSSAFQPLALSLYLLSYPESTRIGNIRICACTFNYHRARNYSASKYSVSIVTCTGMCDYRRGLDS
jgi:hypothetical protein